jgi:ribosomal protein L3 glutamine methyltransferase
LKSARPAAPRDVGGWWREIERRFARGRLYFGHGTENASDEAAWLICHVLKIPFDELSGALDRPVRGPAARRLAAIAARRLRTREPLAYLLHEAWLVDHRFYIDRRAIVPRSHIAELIPLGLARWLPQTGPRRVLDLCTGSGCLAILAALAFPNADVDAADLSRDALKVARRNVVDYRLQKRVRLVASDLFSELVSMRYDLILCNPPYVTDSAMRRLPAEYRAEPRFALAGGTDGMKIVSRLLAAAPPHLTAKGILIVEVGDGRLRVERGFPKLSLTWLATGASDAAVFLVQAATLQSTSFAP